MKNYTITVNGNVYQVTVEEGRTAGVVQKQAEAPEVKAEAPKAPVSQAEGKTKIVAPMPGKILSVKAKAGDSVKKGQVVLILEAMKMENEVVAPSDGTVASINVSVGDMVESGDVLATLN